MSNKKQIYIPNQSTKCIIIGNFPDVKTMVKFNKEQQKLRNRTIK